MRQSGQMVERIDMDDNFGYLLANEQDVAATEYKILVNDRDHKCLRCMQVRCNGRVMFFYQNQGTPLRRIAPLLEIEDYRKFARQLIASILQVKENGFLTVTNIDLSPDRIFVDPDTLKPYLVYVPCRIHRFESIDAFSRVLAKLLLQTLQDSADANTGPAREIGQKLSYNGLSLNDLYSIINGTFRGNGMGGVIQEKPRGVLVLSQVNTRQGTSFQITKSSFVIGRRPDMCDGVVPNTRVVGKVHARISRSNGAYYIEDLKSKNGTFLNHSRLGPQPVMISSGDLIRFGDTEFRAEIF